MVKRTDEFRSTGISNAYNPANPESHCILYSPEITSKNVRLLSLSFPPLVYFSNLVMWMQIELSARILSILVCKRDNGKYCVHCVVRTVYGMVAAMVTIDWAVSLIITVLSLLSGKKYCRPETTHLLRKVYFIQPQHTFPRKSSGLHDTFM